jgi:diadenosine tetraphosphate (Ap4A) HIT family hydrolase
MGEGACYACREAADTELPPRARVLRTEHWRVVHTFEGGLPGWLVALPIRHVTAMAELTGEEAAELGPLLVDLSRVLTDELGCLKTYVMQFSEADGFSHTHFHVVPRMADQPAGLKGPGVFGALTGRATDAATTDAQDRLAAVLSTRLQALRGRAG